MSEQSLETKTYRWITNLYMPFDRIDRGYLAKLPDYKIGAPQVATNRENPISAQELRDFNIVGIYTPDAPLGAEFSALGGHLAKYLNASCHYIGRQ